MRASGKRHRASDRHHGLRPKPLTSALVAACIALVPSIAAVKAAHAGGTIVVGNCNDGGSGSLRDAIASSPDGGTVDLSALTCSVITLNSQLRVAQNALDIIGPGQDALTIDADQRDRVIVHSGSGTLRVSNVTLANGTYRGGTYYGERGGCVLSLGSFLASNTTISSCTLTDEYSPPVPATGGGGCIHAGVDVTLIDSRVAGCDATLAIISSELDGGGIASFGGDIGMVRSSLSGVRTQSDFTFGVGLSTSGGLTMKYSTIEDNADIGDAALDQQSQSGGVQVNGPVYLLASTIANNRAGQGGAGAMGAGSESIRIKNSTIANNVATDAGSGGLTIVQATDVVIANSTIAFNRGDSSTASGLRLYDAAVELRSTIIAKNLAGTAERDIGGNAASSVSGSNNLIPAAVIAVPGDTMTDDPLLRPLHHNGGRTATLALQSTSPAIDQGANPLDIDNDQRGPGFVREFGAAADIGAFEYQPDADMIFWDGFDV